MKVCSQFTIKFKNEYVDYVVVCIIIRGNNGNEENKIRSVYLAFMKDLFVTENQSNTNTSYQYAIDLNDDRNSKYLINMNNIVPHLIYMYLCMNGNNQLLKYWKAVVPRSDNNKLIEFNTQRQIATGLHSGYYGYQFVPFYTVIDDKLEVSYENSNGAISVVSLTEQAKSGNEIFFTALVHGRRKICYKLTDGIDIFISSNTDAGDSFSIPYQLLINCKKSTEYVRDIKLVIETRAFQKYKYKTQKRCSS